MKRVVVLGKPGAMRVVALAKQISTVVTTTRWRGVSSVELLVGWIDRTGAVRATSSFSLN